MANEQINVPSLVVILVLSGLIIRYLFFSAPAGASGTDSRAAAGGGVGSGARQRGGRGAGDSSAASVVRSREAAVERIQQMFPQVDRRTILWDLQRNGGNITATTERILAGRMEAAQGGAGRAAERPAQPDLITRYNLKDKLADASSSVDGEGAGPSADAGARDSKGWSSNKEERQRLLQRRRDQMVLEARRKMEAKMAAEREKEKGSSA